MITVFREKFLRSWPERPDKPLRDCDRAHVVDLGYALERTYTTDAHFSACRAISTSTNVPFRLNRNAFDAGIAVEMTAIVLDVDCEATHGTSAPAPESWRQRLREKVVQLAEDHADPYYYETRGGARIVYQPPEPEVLRSKADAQRWSQAYAVLVAHLARRYGIAADPACGDWQRLYRLPRATRTPGGACERWPVWGNPDQIGVMRVEASTSDLEAAKQRSKAFQCRTIANLTPSPTSGNGLLYELLSARGDVLREHSPGSYVIRCPREGQHSTGRTGDGSTLLYLPAPGEHVGAIHCLHAHCSTMRVRDWVQCFPEARDRRCAA